MSRDLSRLGLSYKLWPWRSRACLCPWKYRYLQCAEHISELIVTSTGQGYQKKTEGALENETVSSGEDVYGPLYSLIPAL